MAKLSGIVLGYMAGKKLCKSSDDSILEKFSLMFAAAAVQQSSNKVDVSGSGVKVFVVWRITIEA